MKGYVLLYADEHKKLITLDAESGNQLDIEYNLEGNEIFLNADSDRFLKKQVLFIGSKKNNRWLLGIYYFTGQKIALTGPPFELPLSTKRILTLNYHNGYLYYLYETEEKIEKKVIKNTILERKPIQCTAVGLPTFSNETSELFYDYSIDRFPIERRFSILSDGLDTAKDIVMLIRKGRSTNKSNKKPFDKVIARMANCEFLKKHTIKELPDKNISMAPPRGTSFSTVIIHGTRQKGYDICMIGHRRNQTRIYIRRMGENDIEIDETEMIPVIGGPLYWKPFWIRGNWWFPVKRDGGVDMVYYSEVQGGTQLSSNFINIPELFLVPDPRDASLLYGLGPKSWRKYALGNSLGDWKTYGGFRSLHFGQKSLCPLPSKTAAGKKIDDLSDYEDLYIKGSPYQNSIFGLSPIENIEIQESLTQSKHYTYLTTKESDANFTVTRKYCLKYNNQYRSSSPPKSPDRYEFHLCWNASYGSDNNIQGFYVPYKEKKSLFIKIVNQLQYVDCSDNAKNRISTVTLKNLKVPDGVYDITWYKKDLHEIKHMEYLGKYKNYDHFFIVTQKNLYQALVDKFGNFTLIDTTGITSPLKEVSFAKLSEDASTISCGGITQLGRTFLAQIDLVPGNDKKLPGFSGITYQYVQNMKEQYIRRPQKMVTWGEQVYILTFKGTLELY
ncbi:hypothetical protein KKC45_04310, partial [Patescibacteria group bacterium]|nr:hypothetical protein [Patescibacteria group bacterium]